MVAGQGVCVGAGGGGGGGACVSCERRECTPSRQENTLAPVYCEQERWKGGGVGGRWGVEGGGGWGEMIGIEESKKKKKKKIFSVNILVIPIS